MKTLKRGLFFLNQLRGGLPREFYLAYKLLNSKARVKYLMLLLFQVTLAFLELIALTVLTFIISFAMNSYTTVSGGQETDIGFLRDLFGDISTESLIGVSIVTYVTIIILKVFVSAIITLINLRFLAKQSASIGFKLSKDLFAQASDLIRFGKSQENLSAVTGGLDSLLIGYLGTISQLTGDFATVLMICIGMMYFDLQTSIVLILSFSLLLFLVNKKVNLVALALGRKMAILGTQLNRRLLDSWLVYREVLLAQKVGKLLESTGEIRVKLSEGKAKLTFLPNLNKYIFELFLILSAVMVSLFQLLINGIGGAISSFLLLIAASSRLLPALLRLQGSLLSLKQSAGSSFYTSQLLEKMEYEKNRSRVIGTKNIEEKCFSPSVEIKHLEFTYPGATNPTLRDMTLTIRSGSFIAITGPSGSGKSTLVDLILGFLIPSKGSVLLSNSDPVVARMSWPGKISYVPQDVHIFEGSIAENITLSPSNEYDQSKLEESLESAGLIDDIDELDEGVNTLVGERGLRLSGGQRQRIGIARALYDNPELLVLDEATSSLDPITQDKIAQRVYQNTKGRTVIVIAHRISTVIQADWVIYLKEGKILGSGTFEDLKESIPEFLEQAELSGL